MTRSAAVSRQFCRSGSATRVPPPSAASVDTPGAGSSSGAVRGGAAKSTRSENGTSTVTSMPVAAVSASPGACGRCDVCVRSNETLLSKLLKLLHDMQDAAPFQVPKSVAALSPLPH